MTKPHRQQYGLGSFVKKAFKKAKKVFKSPLGKAAMLGLGAYGLGGAKFLGGKGIFSGGQGLQRFKNLANIGSALRNRGAASQLTRPAGMPGNLAWNAVQGARKPKGSGIWNWIKNHPKTAFGIGGVGLTGLSYFGGGGGEDEEESLPWNVASDSISNLRKQAQDYYKADKPDYLGSPFMPPKEYVMSGYYGAKDGGIIGLANGGNPAEAQAEQMLRMEYQKYRNQGGTMSYQQFKMAVLQQAQQQGPMAQGQQAPQMAAYGGRMGYEGGELVEDASMVEETPAGMMEENVEEVQGEPTREELEAIALEIFQLPLEQLNEEQLMVVYQAAMEQQPQEEMMQEDIEFNPQMAQPQMAAQGGRMGYLFGKKVGYASANPDFTPTGNFKENMLNVFSNKVSGRNVAAPSKPVAQSSSFMGSLIPQDADYQAYIASGSELPYQAWKASRATAAEGGLMSLGGMEKDYRQEGGFVPLGAKEKADDVPARLSKNEFVFTADAVRNAGGGDIDAGAEVMQNMMENLESGGQISEESQGGGGEMISEEEIVEGPGGAQEMYDQQQMLQSRMA